MKVIDCEQGSAEWLQSRLGRVGASGVANVLALTKNGELATRFNYRKRIIAEILTGSATENYVSPEMLRGIEEEKYARAAYEARQDTLVGQVGMVIHPEIDRSHASPDGLVGNDGCLEIKNPKTETHVEYLKLLKRGVLPPKYEPQVMWQLACTEREWCDFVSFDRRVIHESKKMGHLRVYRNEARIQEITSHVRQFLAEVDAELEILDELYPYTAPEPQEDPMAWASEAQLSNDAIDAFFDAQEQA